MTASPTASRAARDFSHGLQAGLDPAAEGLLWQRRPGGVVKFGHRVHAGCRPQHPQPSALADHLDSDRVLLLLLLPVAAAAARAGGRSGGHCLRDELEEAVDALPDRREHRTVTGKPVHAHPEIPTAPALSPGLS